MTPETEALIARVRERGLNDSNHDFMLTQLATALEAAEKRADAAEAKLKVAREALELQRSGRSRMGGPRA